MCELMTSTVDKSQSNNKVSALTSWKLPTSCVCLLRISSQVCGKQKS